MQNMCVGKGDTIVNPKPCEEPPIADGTMPRPEPCDDIEMCCPESHECMQPRGGGVKQCVGRDDSIIGAKPCEPPSPDEACDCSSKETGCTANGSPLKQCGCFYQEGGREDYICYTVGTCEAEGAQKSGVVKGATWRFCDKNNPNNFDKPPIADGNDCNDAKCEKEPPTKIG